MALEPLDIVFQLGMTSSDEFTLVIGEQDVSGHVVDVTVHGAVGEATEISLRLALVRINQPVTVERKVIATAKRRAKAIIAERSEA